MYLSCDSMITILRPNHVATECCRWYHHYFALVETDECSFTNRGGGGDGDISCIDRYGYCNVAQKQNRPSGSDAPLEATKRKQQYVLTRLRLYRFDRGENLTFFNSSYTGFNVIICCTDLWWYLKAVDTSDCGCWNSTFSHRNCRSDNSSSNHRNVSPWNHQTYRSDCGCNNHIDDRFTNSISGDSDHNHSNKSEHYR